MHQFAQTSTNDLDDNKESRGTSVTVINKYPNDNLYKQIVVYIVKQSILSPLFQVHCVSVIL